MSKQVTLTSGETVTFKSWKRKAEKAYKEALNVRYKRDVDTGEMSLMEEVLASDLDRACEASLAHVIERIDRNDQQILFSVEWLGNLEVLDYALLEAAALELRQKSREGGEKKAGELRDHLETTVGERPPMPEEYEEFLMCQMLGCLPHELEEIDEEKYQLYRGFVQVERAAGRLKNLRSQFYG